ncbi:MAG: MBL fold metallo-hydrolase [Betaproteobacteria bacterium]|nr:MBL fold metallo-hydrolase [Betaproteobacteria bacterium]MDE2622011.1 MBL fold metallo-hydrolase [Betaproteobacteria bacterium]
MPEALVESFFDPATSTLSHLVVDPDTRHCAIIDSVLDYHPNSGRTRTDSADRVIDRVRALDASVQWILETHVHADHLTAAPYLASRLGGRIAIGKRVTNVQQHFGELFNAGPEFHPDGRQFDHLFEDDETFFIGKLPVQSWYTPGHTPACMTYVMNQAAFVGDTLFSPDYGTARCDFPGGNAVSLYRSIRRILELPPQTRLYLCHDYRPGERPVRPWVTVAEQRTDNLQARDAISEEEFVALRHARDATLTAPALLLPSVQINMRAGHRPPPESNGVSYLKIPLDRL